MRVLVAMSGGVDSAVAAARLVSEGLEVVGVTLHLWDYPDHAPEKTRCCAPEDVHDARLVADHLGIPHYAFDRRELFAAEVVRPFVAGYLDGTTPSPCVACNRTVKMRELLALADRLGAARVATGHYARVGRDQGGVPHLERGVDRRKDQSYFLHMLDAGQLERVLFPLGSSLKEEVRAEAAARELPVAGKGESQELCFVPDGDYAAFVEERAGDRLRPGPIVDDGGRTVGRHEGVHRFTVGQRRGLGVALGTPAFVRAIDAVSGTVHVGTEASAIAADLDDVVLSQGVALPLEGTVQVRSQHVGAAGLVTRVDDRVVTRFAQPVRAVAPGQIAVFYDGDRVLGGGTIVRTHAPPSRDMLEVSP
jgi:tRNA-uridine 2-sulfurtransferase